MISQENNARGMLLVLSGPAGVGKDTVWKAAAPCLPSFAKAVTCTTRARRDGEKEGVHYFFVENAAFDALIESGELLEWAEVHGNRYGVPASSVRARLKSGGDVVCIIEVQGALNIRRQFPDSLLVFLKPPPGRETEILKSRIENRGAENAEQIVRRLETASWELTQTAAYDFQIVNEKVDDAARELCDIVMREKQKN